MASAIDPKLMDEIRQAGAKGAVEAVILVEAPSGVKSADERGPAGKMVDRVSKRLKQKPAYVRFLPRLGGVYIKASGAFVKAMVKDPGVISATTSEGMTFSGKAST